MRLPRIRFTVGGLVLCLAIFAVDFAVFRAQPFWAAGRRS
jgi:hypothetical protein